MHDDDEVELDEIDIMPQHVVDECDDVEYRVILVELINDMLDDEVEWTDIMLVELRQIVDERHRDDTHHEIIGELHVQMLLYVELDDDELVHEILQIEIDEIEYLY